MILYDIVELILSILRRDLFDRAIRQKKNNKIIIMISASALSVCLFGRLLPSVPQSAPAQRPASPIAPPYQKPRWHPASPAHRHTRSHRVACLIITLYYAVVQGMRVHPSRQRAKGTPLSRTRRPVTTGAYLWHALLI